MAQESKALITHHENLPVTLDELQIYAAEKKAKYEARRALIRAIGDIPGAEGYKDAAIEAGILDIGLGWEAMAQIGKLLSESDEAIGGRPCKDEKPAIGDGGLSDRHYRAFARACLRARINKILDTLIQMALETKQLPRWTAPLGGPIVQRMTGEQENYTPETLIKKVRKVLGNIDLDPASCALAQKTVQAKRYFNEKENGLKQSWLGRVFLNPPYTAKIINRWIEKLIVELPHLDSAILLTNDNTDTAWFCQAAEMCTAICFVGRVHFYTIDSIEINPTNGQAVFYFGKKLRIFAQEFIEMGPVMIIYRKIENNA